MVFDHTSKTTSVSVAFLTLFPVFGNVLKHGLSYFIYYLPTGGWVAVLKGEKKKKRNKKTIKKRKKHAERCIIKQTINENKLPRNKLTIECSN